ncbi:MAG: HDOD domain-containing protein, partial [Bdellovibrionales bacterium]|nr:HDOD domain-containing protein [Bdellovibrionales bacterium]
MKRISDEELPVLARTAKAITLAQAEQSPMSELGSLILQDPAMTAQVLRLANSALYSPSHDTLNTISRAIVLLGFNRIRSLCLTIATVEELLVGHTRERLVAEMGRSFHAAAQARALAEQLGDESPEEIFVTALLLRLGEMAFWCFGGTLADELECKLLGGSVTPGKAESQLLGFRLTQLSAALCKEWTLGPLLQETFQHSDSPRVRIVLVAHRLAAAVEQGWESQTVEEAVAEFIALTGSTPEAMRTALEERAQAARNFARAHGGNAAAERIPLPAAEAAPPTSSVQEPAPIVESPTPNPSLQLTILREIALHIDSCADVQTLITMVLEGIHR